MKTPIFFLAAIVAFFALPFDFTVMVSVLFSAGLTAIVVADYRRTCRRADIALASAVSGQPPPQYLRLAA